MTNAFHFFFLINECIYCHVLFIWQDFERVLNPTNHLSWWPSGLTNRVRVDGERSLVRFQAETYIPIFKISLVFLFLIAWPSPCKWNQAWPFICSLCCFRPQLWLIIRGLCIYTLPQYFFNVIINIIKSAYQIKYTISLQYKKSISVRRIYLVLHNLKTIFCVDKQTHGSENIFNVRRML